MRIEGGDIGYVWRRLLQTLVTTPVTVAPRGMKIRERVGVQLEVFNARNNVLVSEARNLNYRFMVAEWLWIWFGHSDVETIKQYNSEIARFSDDGMTFLGAYGPPVLSGVNHVMNKLLKDPDSRQAVIDIYGGTEAHLKGFVTKDVPCTLTLQFFIRNGQLDTIANMRSSDIWLGLPYDFFNFSMIANAIAAQLGVPTGRLVMNLGSSHLYQTNYEVAEAALGTHIYGAKSPQLPRFPLVVLDTILQRPHDTDIGALMEPWSSYAKILASRTRMESKGHMTDLTIKAHLI